MTARYPRDTDRHRRNRPSTWKNDLPADLVRPPTKRGIHHPLLNKLVSTNSYGFILLLVLLAVSFPTGPATRP